MVKGAVVGVIQPAKRRPWRDTYVAAQPAASVKTNN
jgi:hypothetical protein